MTDADLSMLKGMIERISELAKYRMGGELGYETSTAHDANPDTSTEPPHTGSPLPVHGPKRKQNKIKANVKDFAHGQRGKNEAGRTTPGITSLPSEPAFTRGNPYTEYGTPYTEAS